MFQFQEQVLTLEEIADFIGRNGLVFLGFEIGGDVLATYRREFPGDLAGVDLRQWQVFEARNPDIFAGMYQFWSEAPCKRRGASCRSPQRNGLMAVMSDTLPSVQPTLNETLNHARVANVFAHYGRAHIPSILAPAGAARIHRCLEEETHYLLTVNSGDGERDVWEGDPAGWTGAKWHA